MKKKIEQKTFKQNQQFKITVIYLLHHMYEKIVNFYLIFLKPPNIRTTI